MFVFPPKSTNIVRLYERSTKFGSSYSEKDADNTETLEYIRSRKT